MSDFTSLYDFLRRAEPGQTYQDDLAADPKRRQVTTYVMLEQVSANTWSVERIVTHFHGKASYVGELERCYDSIHRVVTMSIRGGSIVSESGMYDGQTYRLELIEGVTRYSAKALRSAHQDAVALYGG